MSPLKKTECISFLTSSSCSMCSDLRLIVGQVTPSPQQRCFDPQQTGFKGNLRLLIKPFEQPHLPFKILSAALLNLNSAAAQDQGFLFPAFRELKSGCSFFFFLFL